MQENHARWVRCDTAWVPTNNQQRTKNNEQRTKDNQRLDDVGLTWLVEVAAYSIVLISKSLFPYSNDEKEEDEDDEDDDEERTSDTSSNHSVSLHVRRMKLMLLPIIKIFEANPLGNHDGNMARFNLYLLNHKLPPVVVVPVVVPAMVPPTSAVVTKNSWWGSCKSPSNNHRRSMVYNGVHTSRISRVMNSCTAGSPCRENASTAEANDAPL